MTKENLPSGEETKVTSALTDNNLQIQPDKKRKALKRSLMTPPEDNERIKETKSDDKSVVVADSGSHTGNTSDVPDTYQHSSEVAGKRFVRINPMKFPQLNEADKPLGTIENIEHMLNIYKVMVSYDVIAKDINIAIPGLTSSKDNYRSVAESELASLAVLNGIYSSNFERFVLAIANRHQVNPIMQWVKSKAWDGVDRTSELYDTVTVAEDFPDGFKCLLMQKWLLSAIAAAALPEGFSSRGVLTFQGSQGLGKTRWVAKLIDDTKLASQCILLDHHMDASNKDSLINACRHWLVELGELDSSLRKDISRLKGFITNKEDKIRVPYAKRESIFPRRTVFAATVNDDEFLVDPTGNTRWFCLPCINIDHTHNIDMQQLWAQVYETMFKDEKSPQWWLTDDEQIQLEKLNANHKKSTAIDDLLIGELNFDAPKTSWRRLSASDVLKEVGIPIPSNQQAKECANFLREHIGASTKSQGKVRWLVPPTQEARKEHFHVPTCRKDEDDDQY